MKPRAILLWGSLLLCDTVVQVAMKRASASVDLGTPDIAGLAPVIADPNLWLAAGSYAGAFVTWMLILKRSNLGSAFVVTALAYPAVMLASWLLLGESVSAGRLAGVVIIIAGVTLEGCEPQISRENSAVGHAAVRDVA